jgi:hypothetical protein
VDWGGVMGCLLLTCAGRGGAEIALGRRGRYDVVVVGRGMCWVCFGRAGGAREEWLWGGGVEMAGYA